MQRSRPPAVRRLLEGLYLGSGVLAGIFLVLIAVLTVGQVVGRAFGFAAYAFDEFAAYCMAASSFLGLAYTFRANEHIRVSLLIARIGGSGRRACEVLGLAVTLCLLAFFTLFAIEMTWFSFRFHDVSQGLVPVPLWIPQSGMALGLVVFTVALLDDFIVGVRGGEPSYLRAEKSKRE